MYIRMHFTKFLYCCNATNISPTVFFSFPHKLVGLLLLIKFCVAWEWILSFFYACKQCNKNTKSTSVPIALTPALFVTLLKAKMATFGLSCSKGFQFFMGKDAVCMYVVSECTTKEAQSCDLKDLSLKVV